jgi:hypothetical protein
MRVRLPAASKRLVVLGSGTCWVSRLPVQFGDRAVVDLVEATHLELRQKPDAAARSLVGQRTWSILDANGERRDLVPWERLVPIEGRMERRLVARTVVPRGRVVVEEVGSSASRRHTATARHAHEVLELSW